MSTAMYKKIQDIHVVEKNRTPMRIINRLFETSLILSMEKLYHKVGKFAVDRLGTMANSAYNIGYETFTGLYQTIPCGNDHWFIDQVTGCFY